jgi:hypothetical protein
LFHKSVFIKLSIASIILKSLLASNLFKISKVAFFSIFEKAKCFSF